MKKKFIPIFLVSLVLLSSCGDSEFVDSDKTEVSSIISNNEAKTAPDYKKLSVITSIERYEVSGDDEKVTTYKKTLQSYLDTYRKEGLIDEEFELKEGEVQANSYNISEIDISQIKIDSESFDEEISTFGDSNVEVTYKKRNDEYQVIISKSTLSKSSSSGIDCSYVYSFNEYNFLTYEATEFYAHEELESSEFKVDMVLSNTYTYSK